MKKKKKRCDDDEMARLIAALLRFRCSCRGTIARTKFLRSILKST